MCLSILPVTTVLIRPVNIGCTIPDIFSEMTMTSTLESPEGGAIQKYMLEEVTDV